MVSVFEKITQVPPEQKRMKANELFELFRNPGTSEAEEFANAHSIHTALSGDIDNINTQYRTKDTSREKWSLLHFAIARGDQMIFDLLLQAKHIQLHTKDKHGSSPLHLAASQGNKGFVEALIKKYSENCNGDQSKIEKFVDATNGAGRTTLHEAARTASKEVMEVLVANGANVHATTKVGHSTPLKYAVQKYIRTEETVGAEAIRFLMKQGANPHAESLVYKEGYTTPLKLVQEAGCPGILEVSTVDQIVRDTAQPSINASPNQIEKPVTSRLSSPLGEADLEQVTNVGTFENLEVQVDDCIQTKTTRLFSLLRSDIYFFPVYWNTSLAEIPTLVAENKMSVDERIFDEKGAFEAVTARFKESFQQRKDDLVTKLVAVVKEYAQSNLDPRVRGNPIRELVSAFRKHRNAEFKKMVTTHVLASGTKD